MVILSIFSGKLRGLNSDTGRDHLCYQNEVVRILWINNNEIDDNLANHSIAALIHLCFYHPLLVSRNKYERFVER